MSNFALGRMVRMMLVGGVAFGVTRALLIQSQVPQQDHSVIAVFAAIIGAAVSKGHT